MTRWGAEVVVVGDAVAERFDQSVRSLFGLIQRDGPEVWEQLARPAKALRWRLATDPAPVYGNQYLKSAVEAIDLSVSRLRSAVTDNDLLDEVAESAGALLRHESPIGRVLLDSVLEAGTPSCVVVAASVRSREAMRSWLEPLGAVVVTHRELDAHGGKDIAYFVGPPRFFQPGAVTSPHTSEISFIMPGWFSDRRIPRSPFSEYAEGALNVESKVVIVGASGLQGAESSVDMSEEELLPQPEWTGAHSPRDLSVEEQIDARKLLLSGEQALWLDEDGERIRSLDPTQPLGERVTYVDVSAVTPGVYLLLRDGASEQEALRARALDRLGGRAVSVSETQHRWKLSLSAQLAARGIRECERDLALLGVRSTRQLRSWTSAHVIRPQSDNDFNVLLGWLGLPIDETVRNATALRHEVYRAAAELRDRLEDAADALSLEELERTGHLRLKLDDPGFSGMFVSRVLAVSPASEVVSRYDIRVPFADEGARWLE